MLKESMSRLAARPEVVGAALLSSDGLPVQSTFPPGADTDAAVALAATMARHGDELGTAVGGEDAGSFVLDFATRVVIISRLDRDTRLLILARGDADLGDLLYLLRQEQDALAAQL